jgi:hypothetical protein
LWFGIELSNVLPESLSKSVCIFLGGLGEVAKFLAGSFEFQELATEKRAASMWAFAMWAFAMWAFAILL